MPYDNQYAMIRWKLCKHVNVIGGTWYHSQPQHKLSSEKLLCTSVVVPDDAIIVH